MTIIKINPISFLLASIVYLIINISYAASGDVDLSLSLQPQPDIHVIQGIPFDVILSVENSSDVDASHINITWPVPSTYILLSVSSAKHNTTNSSWERDSDADYNKVTGLLAVEQLEANTTTNFIMRLVTVSNSAPLIQAQITSVDQNDSDSTPDNGFNNAEDDYSQLSPVLSSTLVNGYCKKLDVVTFGTNPSLSPLGEYIVTPIQQNQKGFLWGKGRIDLSKPFDIELSVYLGNNNAGADGMAFTLHNDPRGTSAKGSAGGWLGVDGAPRYAPYGVTTPQIQPAITFEFDTFDNYFMIGGQSSEPNSSQDHTTVFLDGDTWSWSGVGSPPPLMQTQLLGNIEDGKYHFTRYIWNPQTKELTYYFDKKLIGTINFDLANHLGDDLAYWGFTGSTGLYSNEQKACWVRPPDVIDAQNFDYGDAPNTQSNTSTKNYRTTLQNHGARHGIITTDIYLGNTAPDIDSGLLQNESATADNTTNNNDEDSISTFPTISEDTSEYSIEQIPLHNATDEDAFLYAWIDINQNGRFDGNEATVTIVPSGSLSANLNWIGLSGAIKGDSYIRLRLTTHALVNTNYADRTQEDTRSYGVARDGEIEDYAITIEESSSPCDLKTGQASQVNLVVKTKLKAGDLLIIPSSDLDQHSGHLKAYAINNNGQIASTASWDAASLMSSNQRSDALYTEQDSQLTLLSSVSNNVLDVNDTTTASIIKNYTINPSYDSGRYLFDRQDGSFLGMLSRGNSHYLVNKDFDPLKYLKSSDYQQFVNDHYKQRTDQVLLTSDDGFLYSFSYSNGALHWGWMPKILAKSLKNYESFQSSQFMNGHIDVIDAYDATSGYATYIVGSYKSGLAHYILQYDKTDATGTHLNKVIQDTDYSAVYLSGLKNGEKTFFTDHLNKTYMVYGFINQNKQSTLKLQSITDDSVDYTLSINAELSAKPYITADYHSRLGPQQNELFIGTQNGKVLSAPLLSSNGVLNSQSEIQGALDDTPIIDIAENQEIQYIKIVRSSTKFLLLAQTKNSIIVYQYNPSSRKWQPQWITSTQSRGSWDSTGTFSEQLSTTQISLTEPSLGIQQLPSNATISDEVTIINGTIVIPITVETSTECQAYFYLLKLENGYYPEQSTFGTDGQNLSQHILLGTGLASSLSYSEQIDTNKLIGFGSAEQDSNGNVAIPVTLFFKDQLQTGIRSWRIIE